MADYGVPPNPPYENRLNLAALRAAAGFRPLIRAEGTPPAPPAPVGDVTPGVAAVVTDYKWPTPDRCGTAFGTFSALYGATTAPGGVVEKRDITSLSIGQLE